MNRLVVPAVVALALVSACSGDDSTIDTTSAGPSSTAAGVDTSAPGPATTTTMPGLTEVPDSGG